MDTYDPATGATLAQLLRDRMGDIEVVVEAVDELPRGANGKFRAVVCRLSAEERMRVAA